MNTITTSQAEFLRSLKFGVLKKSDNVKKFCRRLKYKIIQKPNTMEEKTNKEFSINIEKLIEKVEITIHCGGDNNYPREFLESLANHVQDNLKEAVLQSLQSCLPQLYNDWRSRQQLDNH